MDKDLIVFIGIIAWGVLILAIVKFSTDKVDENDKKIP